MKHAFLVAAHAKYDQLASLLSLLDGENVDIFLHINKNVEMPCIDKLTKDVHRSSVHFVENRIPIIWGGCGLLYAEIEMLKLATSRGSYDYYHFITGQDLPIKPINELTQFLENNLYNNNSHGRMRTNYIVCDQPGKIYRPRIEQHNFFIEHYRDSNAIIRSLFKGLNKAARYIQKAFRINRVSKTGWTLYSGSSWWSITDEFANYIVAQERKIKTLFDNRTFAADEFCFQTLIMNSEYCTSLFHSDDPLQRDNLRLLDFTRGNGLGSPHTYLAADFDEIRTSHNYFCRKFDAEVDSEVIDRVKTELLWQEK